MKKLKVSKRWLEADAYMVVDRSIIAENVGECKYVRDFEMRANLRGEESDECV